MKIKIVSCSFPEAWYHDCIGEEFYVLSLDHSRWIIPYPFSWWGEALPLLIIYKPDCEIIRDGEED